MCEIGCSARISVIETGAIPPSYPVTSGQEARSIGPNLSGQQEKVLHFSEMSCLFGDASINLTRIYGVSSPN